MQHGGIMTGEDDAVWHDAWWYDALDHCCAQHLTAVLSHVRHGYCTPEGGNISLCRQCLHDPSSFATGS